MRLSVQTIKRTVRIIKFAMTVENETAAAWTENLFHFGTENRMNVLFTCQPCWRFNEISETAGLFFTCDLVFIIVSRGDVLSYGKGTLIRELRKDTRVRSGRKPQITQRLVYRVADRMAASGALSESQHTRGTSPVSAFLSVITLYKPYLPRSTMCNESDLEPVHVHAYDVSLLGTLLCGQRTYQSIETTKLISYSRAKWQRATGRLNK